MWKSYWRINKNNLFINFFNKVLLLLLLILFIFPLHGLETHYGFGMGMVVDRSPFVLSKFIFPLSHIYYEYCEGKFSSKNIFFSIGSYNFFGFIPVPEFEIGVIKNNIRIAISGFYDFILGGMSGFSINAGLIIDNFEFKVISLIAYTQPKIDYMESFRYGKIIENINDKGNIPFPFFGIIFGLRF
jgi:hypothetical protein